MREALERGDEERVERAGVFGDGIGIEVLEPEGAARSTSSMMMCLHSKSFCAVSLLVLYCSVRYNCKPTEKF